MGEHVVLVAVIGRNEQEEQAQEHLSELETLGNTFGWQAVARFYQRLHAPHPRTYLGSGKLEEIKRYVQEKGINIVVFDNALSPTHLRNIQGILQTSIYDRSSLILDIFKQRARTAQAKCQVQLARSQYLLPRLTRMWSHLERQRGNTATRGGAGEQEIETDRRRVRHEIVVLKKRLARIKTQNKTQRKRQAALMRVALVGYTNVGKSSLMHALTRAEVLRADKPFATLDTTVRRMKCEGTPVLLSDTIGFIRQLPHELIESFESTLAAVKEADMLLHVVDFSSKSMTEHAETVYKTLKNMQADKKPIILVFNKMDKVCVDPSLHDLSAEDRALLPDAITPHERENLLCARHTPTHVVHTSATKKEGIKALRAIIHKEAHKKAAKRHTLHITS